MQELIAYLKANIEDAKAKMKLPCWNYNWPQIIDIYEEILYKAEEIQQIKETK